MRFSPFILSTPTKPNTYLIKDINGDKIEGKFYERELQKVTSVNVPLQNDEYIVEKILRTRKRNGKVEHLVRWKGYGKGEDSWVDSIKKL